ncbi:MAG: acyl-CoA dehydrogenase family protein [Myxococcales bacterium]|nr:acyl-CoA dehydrogenase family protein [Myxococcales bacterium]
MIDLESVAPFLEPHHRDVAEAAQAFARDVLAPQGQPKDDADARHRARWIVQELGKAGLVKHAHPLDLRACCLVREALAFQSPLADDIYALQCLGSTPIASAGNKAQRERFVGGAVSGDLMAGFAMTEPDAGSDVASLTARAKKTRTGWKLHGHKTLISNAGIADFYSVFASTDHEAGHRGISCFVVPKDAPGLFFEKAQILSNPHPLGELFFDDVELPDEALVGERGAGFKLGMATLDSLRTTVAAAAAGMATRALEEATAWSLSRKQFGAPIAELQLIQAKLARMVTELSASRLLIYRAAHEKDTQGGRVSLPCAMAKLHATESAQRIIDDAVQIFGGRGVLAESVVDQLYRAIRPLRIYEGTSEVQHLVIARGWLKAFQARTH